MLRAVRQHSRLISSALVAAIKRSASSTPAARSTGMLAAFPSTTITSSRSCISCSTLCFESITVRSLPSLASRPVTALPTLPSPATMIFMFSSLGLPRPAGPSLPRLFRRAPGLFVMPLL